MALVIAALAAMTIGVVLQVSGLTTRLEQDTLDARFQLRAERPPQDVAVVAIDDVTFSELGQAWPFRRSLHARAIDRLTAAGAKLIVYDVQFTEPTIEAEDLALYDAVARSKRVVLATTESDDGATNILGGDENLRAAGARAGAANLPTDAGEVIRRFPHSVAGPESLGVVAAERATGREQALSDYDGGEAYIDFAGPPGTVPTTSFADLLEGRTPASAFRGKVVVVGASAPSLQDVHATPFTDDGPMPGPEVQANAISTAMRGLPLRVAPRWLDIVAFLALGLVAPLLAWRLRLPVALAVSVLAGAAYVTGAFLAFGAGLIVPVTVPIATLLAGMVGAGLARYLGEIRERRRYATYSRLLEETVAERTAELRLAQREIVERLAHAADWREHETGRHIERVGRLCEALALELGLPGGEAETIRLAASLHDIGKIGIPDAVLLKNGPLDPEEWRLMRGHTTIGGDILGGSTSPLMRYAEQIARTHHEHWDGAGYPEGLAGTDIPLAGRICAICDVFDALCSARAYKDDWPLQHVLDELRGKAGRQFDPQLVASFVRIAPALHAELGYGTAATAPAVSG